MKGGKTFTGIGRLKSGAGVFSVNDAFGRIEHNNDSDMVGISNDLICGRGDALLRGHAAIGVRRDAKEELVAELGAAFLCADLDITPEIRDDHAAYLNHWLSILREDNRAIFSAAAHAQRAADFLNALQPSADRPEHPVEVAHAA